MMIDGFEDIFLFFSLAILSIFFFFNRAFYNYMMYIHVLIGLYICVHDFLLGCGFSYGRMDGFLSGCLSFGFFGVMCIVE